MVHLDNVKYGRASLLYWRKINFKSLAGDVCMAHLKLSLSYFLDVMRNDHIRQETKEKCQMNEKSGVDPPPSPTTPTSYRQLFCNMRQV